VEKQIITIFAGINGFVDDLPASECGAFEHALNNFLDTSQPGLLQKIREKKTLDDELREQVQKALKDFKERFAVERGARAAG